MIHPDEAERRANLDYFEAMMKVARAMGVQKLVTEAGHYHSNEPEPPVPHHFREEVWKTMVTTGKELARRAEAQDVELADLLGPGGPDTPTRRWLLGEGGAAPRPASAAPLGCTRAPPFRGPVAGARTLEVLAAVRASAFVLEAGRTLLLDPALLAAQAAGVGILLMGKA